VRVIKRARSPGRKCEGSKVLLSFFFFPFFALPFRLFIFYFPQMSETSLCSTGGQDHHAVCSVRETSTEAKCRSAHADVFFFRFGAFNPFFSSSSEPSHVEPNSTVSSSSLISIKRIQLKNFRRGFAVSAYCFLFDIAQSQTNLAAAHR
jgi:hypothetical protein